MFTILELKLEVGKVFQLEITGILTGYQFTSGRAGSNRFQIGNQAGMELKLRDEEENLVGFKIGNDVEEGSYYELRIEDDARVGSSSLKIEKVPGVAVIGGIPGAEVGGVIEAVAEYEGEVGAHSDKDTDLNNWKNDLSGQLIMEDVDEEEGEDQNEVIDVQVKEGAGDGGEIAGIADLDGGQEAFRNVVAGEDFCGKITSTFSISAQPIRKPVVSSTTAKKTKSPAGQGSMSKRRFMCSHCGKVYQNEQRLYCHEMSHLPGGQPKPFVCSECNRGFSYKQLLKQHERIHSDERPFKCPICSQAFRQLATLSRHKKRHRNQN